MITFLPIQPSVFGPEVWALIHVCARHHPHIVDELLLALVNVLPCLECRRHLGEETPGIVGKPISSYYDATVRRELNTQEVRMFELHNRVNKRRGKPEMSIDVLHKSPSLSTSAVIGTLDGQWSFSPERPKVGNFAATLAAYSVVMHALHACSTASNVFI
jgi:hypothetical protein